MMMIAKFNWESSRHESMHTLCDITGLFAVTSFIAFGSFGTVRGAIALGAGGIGLAAAVPVGVVAWLGTADLVTRFAGGVRPRVEVGVVAAAAFEVFWSAFSLLGILFTRDSRWLVADGADGAVAAASEVEGCVVAADVSPVAGLRPTSARLLRTLCTGPVLRARPFEGETEPDIIRTNILHYTCQTSY